MMKSSVQTLLFLIGCLPSAWGSAQLVPRLSTASCSGHFRDLIVTSATCDYSENGCTYGSQVFVTGQVTANADIPRPMHIHMANTFPSWYNMGMNAYNAEVNDICQTGTLSPPENEDAGYSCPSAGVYNFHFSFKNPGNRRSLFAGWSGYSYGVNVHFRHETEGEDYASCHLNVKVKKSAQDSYLTNTDVVGASLGIAGLALGLFLRRRRERVVGDDCEEADGCNEYNEKGTEMTTNFALVEDSPAIV